MITRYPDVDAIHSTVNGQNIDVKVSLSMAMYLRGGGGIYLNCNILGMGDFGILHVMSLVFYLARGECRT